MARKRSRTPRGYWIEQLPSGSYRAIVPDPTHRERRHTHTFAVPQRYEDAVAWAVNKRRALVTGYQREGIKLPGRDATPLFADWVVAWAADGLPDCTQATLLGYQVQARMLATHWPTERVADITALDVERFVAALRRKGASASTVTSRLTVLRHAMRAAVRTGYRTDDPTLGVRGPRYRSRREARLLTETELAVVADALPEWLRPAPYLGFFAGLRTREVCGLRPCRVLGLAHDTPAMPAIQVVDVLDLDGTLRDHPKYGVRRLVPMSPKLAAVMQHHLDRYAPGRFDPLLSNPRTGEHISPNRFRAEWGRALKVAQLDPEWPVFHDLRHNFCTNLDRNRAPISVIRDLMGHKNLATTSGYVEATDFELRSDWVNRVFGGDTP